MIFPFIGANRDQAQTNREQALAKHDTARALMMAMRAQCDSCADAQGVAIVAPRGANAAAPDIDISIASGIPATVPRKTELCNLCTHQHFQCLRFGLEQFRALLSSQTSLSSPATFLRTALLSFEICVWLLEGSTTPIKRILVGSL